MTPAPIAPIPESLRSFIDAAPAALITIDPLDGHVEYLNPTGLALWGPGAGTMIGRPVTDFWADHDAFALYRSQIIRDGFVRDFEAEFLRPEGGRFWGLVSTNVMQVEGREVRASVVQDITRLKAAEAEARRNEAHYRLLADHAHDVIWTLDLRRQAFTYISPSIQKLRGLTVEQALVEPLEQALTPESLARVRAAFRDIAVSRDRDVNRGIYDQPCADGRIIHVEIITRVVRDTEGAAILVVGVSRDVTAQVETQAARDRLLGELQAALAEVKRLSGLIPICSYCKRVRDDEGYWQGVEKYVTERSEALFSHGICPTCAAAHFPGESLE